MKWVSYALLLPVALLLSACASTAAFEGEGQGWDVHIQPEAPFVLSDDVSLRFADTTFGRYSFKVSRPDHEPFYGILPLKFHDERVLWDILFPPLWALNLRSVYHYYQFDPDAGVVRYRDNAADKWQALEPAPNEIRHAKSYFRD